MTVQVQGVDFCLTPEAVTQPVANATADWLSNLGPIFDDAIGFVITRRFDGPYHSSYEIHKVDRVHNIPGVASAVYYSLWHSLMGPLGAQAFQTLAMSHDFAPTAWQDLDLAIKHELFIGNIFPAEWKRPDVMANTYLADRVWLYRKA